MCSINIYTFLCAIVLLLYNHRSECCSKITFRNTVVKVAVGDSFEPSRSMAINGCITPDATAAQLGNVAIRLIEGYDQNIPTLYEGAVENLSEISQILFSRNKIRQVKQNAFRNLPKLSYLSLSDNYIDTIELNAFNTPSLFTLDLSKNKIAFLETGIFGNLPKLLVIVLNHNELMFFGRHWFSDNSNLTTIYFTNNFIQSIQKYAFKDLPLIQNIDMSHNQINNIHEEAFDGLTSLKSLDIGDNRIKKLERNVFKSLTNLRELWLYGNNITFIFNETLQHLPEQLHMTIHTNPWQCACYTKITTWAAKQNVDLVDAVDCLNDGDPVCIVPEEYGDLCLENRNEDLNAIYYMNYSFNNTCPDAK